ncbi:MAG: outer membrane protein assembly factor BamC [Methylococcaceae bacterium]
MKIKIRYLISITILLNLSACSTIKTWFPDKEKDYQFTTEIPPLILPPDLAGEAIAKVPAAPIVEADDAVHAAPLIETIPAIERKSIQLELVDAGQGAKRLRIGAPLAMSWRLVGKALSRKSIEVTNRIQDEAVFHVQYDPNKQEVEDDSLWDEVIFLFKGLNVTEQAYVVKLVDNHAIENKQQTDVLILDKEQQPVADEAGLKLLMLLHDTIKAGLAE